MTTIEQPEPRSSTFDSVVQSTEPQPRRSFLFGAGAAVAGSLLGASERWPKLLRTQDEPALRTASPSSGVSRTPLGRGVVTRGGPVEIEQDTDVVMDSISMSTGGATGWHTHPGPELILVTKGVLTFRRSDGVRCITEEVSAGQAFVGAAAGELHEAHNAGSGPVDFVVTFLNVPSGAAPRTDADPPPACL